MAKRDYEVGYGKPPKATQFKKGQSGNPSGKRRGTKSLKSDLEEVLNESVIVTIEGRRVKMSLQKMMLLRGVGAAAKGDLKALDEVLKYCVATGLTSHGEPDQPDDISEDDAAILDAFVARQNRKAGDDA